MTLLLGLQKILSSHYAPFPIQAWITTVVFKLGNRDTLQQYIMQIVYRPIL